MESIKQAREIDREIRERIKTQLRGKRRLLPDWDSPDALNICEAHLANMDQMAQAQAMLSQEAREYAEAEAAHTTLIHGVDDATESARHEKEAERAGKAATRLSEEFNKRAPACAEYVQWFASEVVDSAERAANPPADEGRERAFNFLLMMAERWSALKTATVHDG